MKWLSDRNDRMLLGAAGILVGAGALVAVGTGSFVGDAENLLASTAHAATEMPFAHNMTPAALPASIVRSPTDLPASDRRARAADGARRASRRSSGSPISPTARPTATGPSTARCPVPSCGCASATPSRSRLKNHEDSWMQHNVDFHAVTGPGGGGVATVADPGASKGFTFKALNPGLYVYHCAVPMAAQHIANGMYGLILVEPEGGLPPVDHEFYVMQGEIYTEEAFGTKGELTESYEKLLNEMPEYYVFNGAANALAGDNALHAKVGETVRIYFGVGGPNKTSSFHVIGEIFDHAYNLASLTAEPLTDVQTITVPPGGAARGRLQGRGAGHLHARRPRPVAGGARSDRTARGRGRGAAGYLQGQRALEQMGMNH